MAEFGRRSRHQRCALVPPARACRSATRALRRQLDMKHPTFSHLTHPSTRSIPHPTRIFFLIFPPRPFFSLPISFPPAHMSFPRVFLEGTGVWTTCPPCQPTTYPRICILVLSSTLDGPYSNCIGFIACSTRPFSAKGHVEKNFLMSSSLKSRWPDTGDSLWRCITSCL